jgi:hypothetical protein
MHRTRRTFDRDAQRDGLIAFGRGKFFPDLPDGHGKITALGSGRTQALHRVPPLGDRFPGAVDRVSQPVLGLRGSRRKQLIGPLK